MYRKNNIILIGFKGSKKTETARFLSKEMGYAFIDIDQFVESIYFQYTGKRLRYDRILKRHDENYFRQIQRKALHQIMQMNKVVLAAASTIPLDPENRRILRSMGYIIYLKESREDVMKRLKSKPVYVNDLDAYKEAEKVFRNTADLMAAPEEILPKIREHLGGVIG